MASVDVAIPCYKYGHFLEQSVMSVLAQDKVEARVLILDDASPDNTPEVGHMLAERDCRVTYRRHTQNQGHLATYNEGITWASGDYFLLLSADDYITPGALGRANDLMDMHPEIGFVFGGVYVMRKDAGDVHVRAFEDIGPDGGEFVMTGRQFIDRSGAGNLVPTPTAIVRCALQKEVGGYDMELPHCGDQEMWLRLAARASVGYIHTDQAIYRQHGANMSVDYFDAMVPDVEQRTAAIDRFFETSGHLMADASDLHQRMRLELARFAVSRASIAFNNDNFALSRELSRLSERLHPGIVKTLPHLKLAMKRAMGATAWHALQKTGRRTAQRS